MRKYSSFNRDHHSVEQVRVVAPLKSKNGSETDDAIAEIIRESGRCSKNLQANIGKEFYNTDVQKIFKKHDVNHYSTYSTLEASVVELFNRTLKNDNGKCLDSTAITNESSCRVSYQITTCALSAYDLPT